MCMTRKSQSLLLSLNPSASDGILTWRTSLAKQMANQIWHDNDTASDWLNKKLVMICIYHELLSFKKKTNSIDESHSFENRDFELWTSDETKQ